MIRMFVLSSLKALGVMLFWYMSYKMLTRMVDKGHNLAVDRLEEDNKQLTEGQEQLTEDRKTVEMHVKTLSQELKELEMREAHLQAQLKEGYKQLEEGHKRLIEDQGRLIEDKEQLMVRYNCLEVYGKKLSKDLKELQKLEEYCNTQLEIISKCRDDSI